MKSAKALFAAVLAGLALLAASAPASAHGYYRGGHYYGGPRVTFGFYGGPGYWGPGYWRPGYWGGYWGPGYWGSSYYYAPPPVVVVPSEPRVYVERDAAPASSSGEQWWYWCASAKGYYPYVSTCSEGWQRVPPQPAQAPR